MLCPPRENARLANVAVLSCGGAVRFGSRKSPVRIRPPRLAFTREYSRPSVPPASPSRHDHAYGLGTLRSSDARPLEPEQAGSTEHTMEQSVGANGTASGPKRTIIVGAVWSRHPTSARSARYGRRFRTVSPPEWVVPLPTHRSWASRGRSITGVCQCDCETRVAVGPMTDNKPLDVVIDPVTGHMYVATFKAIWRIRKL